MEQLIFAEALFADLISLHPLLCSLPPAVHKQVDDYDSTIGKAIMIVWFNVRKLINLKLRHDSSKFTETQDSFKKYLIGVADFALSSADTLHDKIFVLSASLLELISFLYRRGITDHIYNAPHYWLHMFQLIDSADFCEQGGWHALKVAAKKQAEDYDKIKDLLQMQYWSEDIGKASRSTSDEIPQKLQAQGSTETSSGEFAEESPSNEKSEEMTVTGRILPAETAEQLQIGRCTNEVIKRSHDVKLDSEEASTLQVTHIKETASQFETKVAEKKAADETEINSAQTVFDVSEQYRLSTKQTENFELNKNESKILVILTEPIAPGELPIDKILEGEKSQIFKEESLEMTSGKDHGINITVRLETHKTPCKDGETSTESPSQAKLAGNTPKLSIVNSANKTVTPKSKAVTPKSIKSEASPALHTTPNNRGDSKFGPGPLRKTPSDRERFPKCQSKSSGEEEKNRRLSLPKGSSETSKQSRRTNSAKAKSESKTDRNNKDLQRLGPSSSKQSNMKESESKTDKNKLQCPGSSSSKQSNMKESESKSDKNKLQCPGSSSSKQSIDAKKPYSKTDNTKRSQCLPSGMQSSSKPSNVQGKSSRFVTTASEISYYAKGSRKLYESHSQKSGQSSSESIESAKATGGQTNPRKIHSKDPKSEKPRWK